MNAFRNHILRVASLETIKFSSISFIILSWPIIISYGTSATEESLANVENKEWLLTKQTFRTPASTPKQGTKSIPFTDRENAFSSNQISHISLAFRKLLIMIWDRWSCSEENVWLLEVPVTFSSSNRLKI